MDRKKAGAVAIVLIVGFLAGWIGNELVRDVPESDPNKTKPKPPELWADPVRISYFEVQLVNSEYHVTVRIADADLNYTKCECVYRLYDGDRTADGEGDNWTLLRTLVLEYIHWPQYGAGTISFREIVLLESPTFMKVELELSDGTVLFRRTNP